MDEQKTKFTFLGISRKPKLGGVEMCAFIIDWNGEIRRVSVAVEDELLAEWGYNKLGVRVGQYGDMPTLTELLEKIGTYYLTELISLREEPHGYIFSKKDFIKSEDVLMSLEEVMERLKANQFILHRPHQYE